MIKQALVQINVFNRSGAILLAESCRDLLHSHRFHIPSNSVDSDESRLLAFSKKCKKKFSLNNRAKISYIALTFIKIKGQLILLLNSPLVKKLYIHH